MVHHHPASNSGEKVDAAPADHSMHGKHAAQTKPDADAGHASHDRHAGHSVAMFRDKFWVSLLLTVPTLVWGHMLQSALGYSPPTFPGSHWIPAVFGTAVFVYGGTPFLQGAVREIKDRLPGMMTLIALATFRASSSSVAPAIAR